jgi:hypothetical protein
LAAGNGFKAGRWLATGLLTAEEGFRRVPHYRDLPTLVIHLATKRDEENLGALCERLPKWLLEEVSQEQHDAYEATSADVLVDFADRAMVGSRT